MNGGNTERVLIEETVRLYDVFCVVCLDDLVSIRSLYCRRLSRLPIIVIYSVTGIRHLTSCCHSWVDIIHRPSRFFNISWYSSNVSDISEVDNISNILHLCLIPFLAQFIFRKLCSKPAVNSFSENLSLCPTLFPVFV